MKFKLKVDNLSFTLEPKYNFGNEPALEVTIENYEIKGEAGALIKGINDLAKQLMPQLAEFDETIKEAA
jgi:hypothetical protein